MGWPWLAVCNSTVQAILMCRQLACLSLLYAIAYRISRDKLLANLPVSVAWISTLAVPSDGLYTPFVSALCFSSSFCQVIIYG